jgi:SAM-dependent methyltransferase
MIGIQRILELPFVYRTWQAPFARRKFAPVTRSYDLESARRVLDIACGPGTNAPRFASAEYVGVDLNDNYIRTARRRFRGRFIQADAIDWSSESDELFDFVLVNSFLHHLDDQMVERLLANLVRRLTIGGRIHMLELVLPPREGIAHTLTRLDRGKFARPFEAWRELLERVVKVVRFEPYVIDLLGVPLWHMVYAVGLPQD